MGAFVCFFVSIYLTGEVALLTGRRIRVWPIGVDADARGLRNTRFGMVFTTAFTVVFIGAAQLSMLVFLVYPGSSILARVASLFELIAVAAWLVYLVRLPGDL